MFIRFRSLSVGGGSSRRGNKMNRVNGKLLIYFYDNFPIEVVLNVDLLQISGAQQPVEAIN